MKLADVILEDKEVYQLNRILEGVTEEDIKAVHESEKPLLNEALVSIIIGAVMAAPKIIEYLAQVIRFIVKIFKPLKNKDGDFETGENKVSDWIEKQGHTLHHKYIHVVMKVVKLLGVAKSVWKNKETGEVDKKKLEQQKLKEEAKKKAEEEKAREEEEKRKRRGAQTENGGLCHRVDF